MYVSPRISSKGCLWNPKHRPYAPKTSSSTTSSASTSHPKANADKLTIFKRKQRRSGSSCSDRRRKHLSSSWARCCSRSRRVSSRCRGLRRKKYPQHLTKSCHYRRPNLRSGGCKRWSRRGKPARLRKVALGKGTKTQASSIRPEMRSSKTLPSF